jgi:hypothetical protein
MLGLVMTCKYLAFRNPTISDLVNNHNARIPICKFIKIDLRQSYEIRYCKKDEGYLICPKYNGNKH